jgi:hypothetical protein
MKIIENNPLFARSAAQWQELEDLEPKWKLTQEMRFVVLQPSYDIQS